MPKIASVFNRSAIKYDFVIRCLHDEMVWTETGGWTEAASVAKTMRETRPVVPDHYYECQQGNDYENIATSMIAEKIE